MSEPKFTPGPLSVNEEMPETWVVRDDFGNATMFTNLGHYSNETRKANAILYSAAPEMYECLQKLCFLCGGRSIKSSRECRKCGVKNVLKKARGEK